ncbi:MAG: type II secretion system F family protein [Candidatus Eremiobacteraeota bacterium]|nr:type II secretion system F family protein [Candidatus Eremiobacteraeota bacterium]
MVFYYAARHPDGVRVSGSIGADSRDVALEHLRARGLFVTLLETTETARGALARVRLLAARSSASGPAFFRSFATLIGVGIPIKRALETLIAETPDRAFAERLRSIAADVESGTSLSGAMERHASEFSGVTLATIKAGEASGALAAALQSVAELEERNRALRKRIGSALAYPAVVSIAATALVLFLIADTMPAFAGMFAEMHVSLPPVTRVLIALGTLLQRPQVWAGTAIAVAAAVVAAMQVRTAGPFATSLDRLRLRVPLAGPILRKALVVRFARTLGSLLAAGVDVVSALQTAAVVAGPAFAERLAGAPAGLSGGETVASVLESARFFDPTFLLLVRVGEESGTLDAMLARVATYYEIDVDAGLAALTSVIEPALICVLGAAIGTIVASVIVPLYSMIGSIQ